MTLKEADIVILTWGLAFADAEDNPQAMLSGRMTSDEAARRMRVLGEAETKLLELPDAVCPRQLLRFKAAHQDRGCLSCWLSSFGAEHSACERKMAEYFDAREALLKDIEAGFDSVEDLARWAGDLRGER